MGTRATPRPAAGADRWFGIKTRIHAKLLTILTPEQLRALNKDGVREQLGVSIERIVRDEGIPLNAGERDRLIEEVLDEVFGLGPLEALMKDMTISDIMVNGPDSIYVASSPTSAAASMTPRPSSTPAWAMAPASAPSSRPSRSTAPSCPSAASASGCSPSTISSASIPSPPASSTSSPAPSKPA
jgi:hypothetical protein